MIEAYVDATQYLYSSYLQVFNRCSSDIGVRASLNPKRVLIIGITDEHVPQCYRYRIAQKMEQLARARYQAKEVSYTCTSAAMAELNWHDVIIFYRVPAMPATIKMVAYAQSLGKLTFFELDDLLFEPVNPPPLESFGAQVSPTSYTNLTKDAGSYHALARKIGRASCRERV